MPCKSENQRELLDALEKSALRYSIVRLSHVRAIIEGQGCENVGECDYDRKFTHDALISALNAFVRSLPEQEDKKFFSPWLGNRHAIGLLGLELAFHIAKSY